jgi:hypothetical protein
LRNSDETGKRVFVGKSANWGGDLGNTKRPGVIFHFFTRLKRYQDGDPEAGCDVKVGFCEPQSLDRGPSRQRREATSDAVVGRRAKLLIGFSEYHWQAGLQLPFRAVTSEPPATPKRKPSFSGETDRPTKSGGLVRRWKYPLVISSNSM